MTGLVVFTYEDCTNVNQIKKHLYVNLIYQNGDMLFMECTGKGEIVKDKDILKGK